MAETVRAAIGAALDHPFHEQGFRLVDLIEANVLDNDCPPSTAQEVAAELTDCILEGFSTLELAVVWAITSADGAGDDYVSDVTTGTFGRIKADLFATIEPAVCAGLAAAIREG